MKFHPMIINFNVLCGTHLVLHSSGKHESIICIVCTMS